MYLRGFFERYYGILILSEGLAGICGKGDLGIVSPALTDDPDSLSIPVLP